MGALENKVYSPDVKHNNLPLEDYYNKTEQFGHFGDNGRTYTITRRDTPRPWLQYLCNDKVFSCVSNIGSGLLRHISGVRVTKLLEKGGNYIIRVPNGRRFLDISVDGGKVFDFFLESENYSLTVSPGTAVYKGEIDGIKIELTMFVPEEAPCECWNIKLLSEKDATVSLFARQDWGFWLAGIDKTLPTLETSIGENKITALAHNITGIFAANEVLKITEEDIPDTIFVNTEVNYKRVSLANTISLKKGEAYNWFVVSAACDSIDEQKLVEACLNAETNQKELCRVKAKWDKIFQNNICSLPDKVMENFANYWLKNNLYLTYRFDRGGRLIGYRDALQDSWGYCLVDAEKAKEKIVLTLSKMYADGRCPRQFSKVNDELDVRDFSDSPIWAPNAVSAYIKETGDFSILDKPLPFLDSNETSSLEDHIFRALSYLYENRGKNGLIRVRDGDWLDGLGGINKYGDDATSAWVTVATFYAQNIMLELYNEIGDEEKAHLMRSRSDDLKESFNRVAWDGNWFTYAFFEDGEPIGSHKNLEGKIFLNVQTWALFSGIIDSEEKIEKIKRSISIYLQTPFGPLLNYPPYVFYGERCGRLQNQAPGTFANSAVYNHGAAFKVFADVATGDYDLAVDTFRRAIPNHPDNSDLCRTSEPYSIGNVYYGPNNERFGMNLFAWFTATPAWLIHGIFEQILGVKADYNGLLIEPHVPSDWDSYSVTKIYRGTKYNIKFQRETADKGIYINGEKQDGNIIKSDNATCDVLVKY